MERNKIFLYAVILLPALLIVISLIKINSNGKVIAGNSEYEQYRSNSIPEECRMPEYEDDARLWKEHLSHHEQTFHCLEYYGDIN